MSRFYAPVATTDEDGYGEFFATEVMGANAAVDADGHLRYFLNARKCAKVGILSTRRSCLQYTWTGIKSSGINRERGIELSPIPAQRTPRKDVISLQESAGRLEFQIQKIGSVFKSMGRQPVRCWAVEKSGDLVIRCCYPHGLTGRANGFVYMPTEAEFQALEAEHRAQEALRKLELARARRPKAVKDDRVALAASLVDFATRLIEERDNG